MRTLSLGFLLCAVTLGLVTGCTSQKPAPVDPEQETPTTTTDSPKPSRPQIDPASVSLSDIQAAAEANNRFGVKLFHKIRGAEGNLFFSPLSVHQALGMACAGAGGKTAKEMSSVLAYDMEPDRLYPALGAMMGSLLSDKGDTFVVANALWGQKDSPFKEDYTARVRKFFGAPLHSVDFIGAPGKALESINGWVARQTSQKIKKILMPGDINSMTRLVITNAVYFKGSWSTPFKEKQTQPKDFHVGAGQTVKVDMMSMSEEMGVREAEGCHVLFLPYGDGKLRMAVILPDARDGLAALENSLTLERLRSWLSGPAIPQETQVELPKFKMETQFNLKKPLVEMGMVEAFDSKEADFAAMTNEPEGFFVANVFHKGFVEVNEEGTEAAAVTGMALDLKSEPRSFIADHPFLFVIEDTRSGALLFWGRCVNPKA